MVEGANLIGRFHSWRHGITTFINFFHWIKCGIKMVRNFQSKKNVEENSLLHPFVLKCDTVSDIFYVGNETRLYTGRREVLSI